MPWVTPEFFLYSYTLLKGIATYRWQPEWLRELKKDLPDLDLPRDLACLGYLDLKNKAQQSGNINLLMTIADFEQAAKSLSLEEIAVVVLSSFDIHQEDIAKLLHKSTWWVSVTLRKALRLMKERLNGQSSDGSYE